MEKNFFEYIKTKVETVENIPNVPFDEEGVWKKINSKSNGGYGAKIRNYLISAGVIIGLSLAFFMDENRSAAEQIEPNTKLGEESLEQHLKQDPLPSRSDKSTSVQLIDTDSISYENQNNTVSKEPRDTIRIVNVVEKPIKKHVLIDKAKEDKKEAVITNSEILPKPLVHIYRPSRYVGSGLVFKLKTNGMIIQKVRNGRHYVVPLNIGLTQFAVGKKTLNVNLKPGKEYYIKVPSEGFPIGKPGLELVPKEIAESEIERQ